MATNAFGQPIGEPVANWTPRPAPPRKPAEGRLCRLEPLDADAHAASLFDAFAAAPDARDWTYLPHDRPDDFGRYRTFVEAQVRSDDPLHHAIVVRDDGRIIGEANPATATPAVISRALGTAAFMRIDRANGVIEIGHIVYSPLLQRTIAGTEAIFLLMARAFDELGYRRLEWKCDSLNLRSCRAAERFGFSFEGIFRQAIVTKGRNRDTAWYAMTDRDWPLVRTAFERWLAPENFDPSGRQRQRLDAGTAGRS